jgi:hypothetical protein
MRINTTQQAVTPELAEALLLERPLLVEHACHSGGVERFGERIVGALIPHAVEHVAIDLLVERFAGTGPVSGATRWLDRSLVLAEVCVSCDTDTRVDALATESYGTAPLDDSGTGSGTGTGLRWVSRPRPPAVKKKAKPKAGGAPSPKVVEQALIDAIHLLNRLTAKLAADRTNK